VNVSDSPTLDLPQGTISMWIKPSQIASRSYIFGKGDTNDNTHNFVGRMNAGGTIRFGVGSGVDNAGVEGTETLTTDKYYHYVATWNSSSITLWLNGTHIGTTAHTLTIQTNAQPLWFGGSQRSSETYVNWTGNIDEIGIWNRTLTNQEISDLFNDGNALTPTDVNPSINLIKPNGEATINSNWSFEANISNIGNYFLSNTTPQATPNNQKIGKYAFSGHDGTAFISGALVEGYVDGTNVTGVVPQRISFTTGDNATDRTERLIIKENGNIRIGSGTPTEETGAGDLFVSGGIEVDVLPTSTSPNDVCWDDASGLLFIQVGGCSGGASPFLHAIINGEEIKMGVEFLNNLDQIELKSTQTFPLLDWETSTYRIIEPKQETSYTDMIEKIIIGMNEKGEFTAIVLKANNPTLQNIDNNFVILDYNETYDFTFEEIPTGFNVFYSTIKTNGYYISYKDTKKPSYTIEKEYYEAREIYDDNDNLIRTEKILFIPVTITRDGKTFKHIFEFSQTSLNKVCTSTIEKCEEDINNFIDNRVYDLYENKLRDEIKEDNYKDNLMEDMLTTLTAVKK